MVAELRVFMVALDARLGLFDDSAVRSWLADRELIGVVSVPLGREAPGFEL